MKGRLSKEVHGSLLEFGQKVGSRVQGSQGF